MTEQAYHCHARAWSWSADATLILQAYHQSHISYSAGGRCLHARCARRPSFGNGDDQSRGNQKGRCAILYLRSTVEVLTTRARVGNLTVLV